MYAAESLISVSLFDDALVSDLRPLDGQADRDMTNRVSREFYAHTFITTAALSDNGVAAAEKQFHLPAEADDVWSKNSLDTSTNDAALSDNEKGDRLADAVLTKSEIFAAVADEVKPAATTSNISVVCGRLCLFVILDLLLLLLVLLLVWFLLLAVSYVFYFSVVVL